MEKANTIGVKQQWKKFFFTRKNRRSAKGEENEQLATCHFPLVSRKVFKFLMCYYLEISRRDGEMSKSVIFQNFLFSLFFSFIICLFISFSILLLLLLFYVLAKRCAVDLRPGGCQGSDYYSKRVEAEWDGAMASWVGRTRGPLQVLIKKTYRSTSRPTARLSRSSPLPPFFFFYISLYLAPALSLSIYIKPNQGQLIPPAIAAHWDLFFRLGSTNERHRYLNQTTKSPSKHSSSSTADRRTDKYRSAVRPALCSFCLSLVHSIAIADGRTIRGSQVKGRRAR